jgi:hypothetical protein
MCDRIPVSYTSTEQGGPDEFVKKIAQNCLPPNRLELWVVRLNPARVYSGSFKKSHITQKVAQSIYVVKLLLKIYCVKK